MFIIPFQTFVYELTALAPALGNSIVCVYMFFYGVGRKVSSDQDEGQAMWARRSGAQSEQ